MKRRSRELVIFSMSALDLFASALGAFILVTIILLPYYLKHDDVVRENNKMREQITELEDAASKSVSKKELEKAQEEITQLKQKLTLNSNVSKRLRDAEKRAKRAEERIKTATSSAKKSKAALNEAREEVKRRVKFALLGLATNAQSFVIVMDMSGSMKRFRNITLQTMQKILEPMSNKEKLGIIGFHAPGTRAFYTIQLPRWPNVGAIAPMTTQNKDMAMNFVRNMMGRVDGGTPTMNGLMVALQYNVDAIILMSDGQPTVPNRNWQQVIQNITRRNGGRKEIHTVAIGNFYERPTFVTFLSRLARANRGKFTGVALP